MKTAASSKRPSRWGNLGKNVLLVAGSLLLCLLMLEAGLRLFGPDLKRVPGFTYGKAVVKNSHGFRDREYTMAKPQNTYRILVLGDSFTWGVGLDAEETLPKLLESRLSEETSSGEVEVINAAIPGYNTVEEFLLLKEEGVKYDPDMVLVVFNLNDIEYLPELSDQGYEHMEATPVVEVDHDENIADFALHGGVRGFINKIEVRSNLLKFLVPRVGSLLRRMGLIQSTEFSWVARILQGYTDANPGWLEAKRGLKGIADVCRANNCELLVAVYPIFAELKDYKGHQAHQAVLEFCESSGIAAVDLLPLFENTPTMSHWVNIMDSHPNAEAHRRVAEKLLPDIRSKL